MINMDITPWEIFTTADGFGADAVRDTYRRAFAAWKSDYRYLTELVMVLNWKIWDHYEKNNKELASLYNELWTKADNYALDNLKDDELTYFLTITD